MVECRWYWIVMIRIYNLNKFYWIMFLFERVKGLRDSVGFYLVRVGVSFGWIVWREVYVNIKLLKSEGYLCVIF